MNTYYYEIYHTSLETIQWVLSNPSLIVQICQVIHEILANKDFTVTDDLISQLFVVAFVHPTYVQIAFILGFTVQLSLWKLVYWLWRYKLNEVCDSNFSISTPVPLLVAPFNIILHFSDHLAYLLNVPWCIKQIYQKGQLSLRSLFNII